MAGSAPFTEDNLKAFLAWGSISYGIGFVVVMLHTARLGFPVIEILSAVYIWIGFPLAVLAFFSVQIWNYFKSRASELTAEVRDSWSELTDGFEEEDIHAVSRFVGYMGAVTPFFGLIRSPVEKILRKAAQAQPSDRAMHIFDRFASILKGYQALRALLNLFIAALMILLGIYLYGWVFYPLIPQSFGGGAPTTVRLLVNTEKLPPHLRILSGTGEASNDAEEISIKTSLTNPVSLLYRTDDHFYIEGANGQRLSLSKSVVEGIIWNSNE